MYDPARTTRLHQAATESDTSTNLKTFLHSLVPPYFLKWGPTIGVSYALISLTGFLCHIGFMAYIIVSLIRQGLDWLLDTVALPASIAAVATAISQALDWLNRTADLPEWFVVSSIGWWFVSSIWMAFLVKRHHDGTSGWRTFIFGGWAWSFWGRGSSDSDFDFD
jgi:hypothetical protein